MRWVVIALVAACGSSKTDAPATGSAAGSTTAAGSATAGAEITCTQLPFELTTPVPEASGAAWLELDGELALVVISDSGNHGAYAVVDPDTGATLEEGRLPLGGEGQDLEGIAARGGKLYVITSPGWIRVYQRAAAGFDLVDGPYPLGPIDLTDRGGGMGDRPPQGTGMVCGGKHTNCGRNYEGLCLAPDPGASRCVGFAASKADGHLYCLTEAAGRLAVEHAPAISIARPGVVADCAFSDDGTLYVGSNLFDGGQVYRVEGWQDPATATVAKHAALPIGFPETLAVRGDVFYRMSDTGGSPSMMVKHRCVR